MLPRRAQQRRWLRLPSRARDRRFNQFNTIIITAGTITVGITNVIAGIATTTEVAAQLIFSGRPLVLPGA